MITEFGHFALWLALAAAVVQSVVPLWGARNGSAAGMRVADSAAQIQFLAVGVAFAALVRAYVVSDFSLETVALNSHSTKPMLYKVTGVWANHEGSMLLWVMMLALFGMLISLFGRMIPVAMRATVLAVQAIIGVGFYLFILLTSNPFVRVANPPLDGRGMNPLLQDPGVAFHPPLLYLGYVGFSTAFAFALAALITGRVDPAWARWMRPWVLIAWSGLTAGIALGSWWAYYELGWGGFWFWDPVENASFMPWLIGTALLHSAIVVEKRNALLHWTILLAILTFSLSLIGTFLVRSGILSSVHAFANDPERGIFILGLLCLYIGAALTLFAWRAGDLREGGVFAFWSRESGLLVNNVLLSTASGVVFVGTLYPLVLELVTGDKITVGAPYFNQTFLPIFGLTMLAAGIGPFLSWKRARPAVVLRRAALTTAISAALTAGLAVGVGLGEPVGLLGAFIALWLAVATLQDLGHRAGLPNVNARVAVRRVFGLPRSAWGLYIGHTGLSIAAAGVVAVSVWKAEEIRTVSPGTALDVGPYAFTLTETRNETGPNYQTTIATIEVSRDGTPIATLHPERRWYPVEGRPTTEAGIRSLWHGDLYAVLGDPDGAGRNVVRYYYNPGVPWMWLGGVMIALAGLISLTDRRLRIGAPSRRRVSTAQPAE
ncbi:heme lyase CcmF/NrfE family subunit [Tropicimonas isoalkanivorans]|uniref:Cytochrome c-type biogenesis protein CcmF n=1 Tax=Tropicimonas isoalkanivorans TaxID=441112 RepID=A0A1I1EGJ5_9RHOB|nr:heme lyase CcmF/NrfE family subunit [Tropicimonas isoalkanivorans]SFB86294.1 cytochrome c-type biogenesis protein CcmF [Tropicimonas isoalkanivorans]